MRRKIIPVHIQVSSNFYNMLEKRRKRIQAKIGLNKKITQINFTELLFKSGLQFPKINLDALKNVKRKKS